MKILDCVDEDFECCSDSCVNLDKLLEFVTEGYTHVRIDGSIYETEIINSLLFLGEMVEL